MQCTWQALNSCPHKGGGAFCHAYWYGIRCHRNAYHTCVDLGICHFVMCCMTCQTCNGRKMAQFAGLALLKLMVHLALCFSPNLVERMALKGAIAQSCIINCLKIFRKSLMCLFAKLAAGVDVLRPVALVEGHVKSFHLEACAGLLDVSGRSSSMRSISSHQ